MLQYAQLALYRLLEMMEEDAGTAEALVAIGEDSDNYELAAKGAIAEGLAEDAQFAINAAISAYQAADVAEAKTVRLVEIACQP